MNLPPQEIFKAYDIRGVVGKSLTREGVRLIGQALGSELLERTSGGGRPEIVGKTEGAAAFAKRRHLERIFRAADPGPGNRVDPDQFGVLFHRPGLQACQFGLGPPRFALRGLKKSAAAAR